MSNTVNVRVSIKNVTDPSTRAVEAEFVDNEPPTNHQREMLKAHYAESMNGYRYFGGLRAQIAWAPAIILVALITFVAKDTDAMHVTLSRYALPGVMAAVFVAIYWANHYLQIQQRNCSNAAKRAEYYWLKNKEPNYALSFFALRDKNSEDDAGFAGINTKTRPDTPSRCLLIFLTLLWFLHLGAVLVSVGVIKLDASSKTDQTTANEANENAADDADSDNTTPR